MRNVLFLLVFAVIIGGLTSCGTDAVSPDGVARSIFFSFRKSDSTLHVKSGTVLLNKDEKLPDWAQPHFYIEECKSTVRVEDGLYVFTLHSTDGMTLHGQINVNTVALMNSDSVRNCYQATDVRMFDQVLHQKVTSTFEDAEQSVGNKAHEGSRKW